jgi:hypothetical protein
MNEFHLKLAHIVEPYHEQVDYMSALLHKARSSSTFLRLLASSSGSTSACSGALADIMVSRTGQYDKGRLHKAECTSILPRVQNMIRAQHADCFANMQI